MNPLLASSRARDAESAEARGREVASAVAPLRQAQDATSDVALLRAAALSVEESCELMEPGASPSDPLVRQAVALAASGDLLNAEEASPGVGPALRRYVARMGGRATPFGLFAGSCVVPFGDQTDLASTGRDGYSAVARLDMEALEAMVAEAGAEIALDQMPLRRNPTLYRKGAYYRCCRRGEESGEVVRIRATAGLSAVIDFCDQLRSGDEILAMLQRRSPGSSRPALEAFLRQLFERDVVVLDSGLVHPGSEPSAIAVDVLDRMGRAGARAALAEVTDTVQRPQAIGEDYVARLDRSWSVLCERSPRLAETQDGRRYNVELALDVVGSLDRRVADGLDGALRRLETLFPPGGQHLKPFREAFEERYGDGAVPLLEAADAEYGVLGAWIRSSSRIAAGLQLNGNADPALPEARSVQLEAIDHFMRTGEPFDIGDVEPSKQRRTTSVIAGLLGPEATPFRTLLVYGTSRSPAALAARFGLTRPALTKCLRGKVVASFGLDGDEHANPIVAEIAHTPGGHVGNVLIRPRLCDDVIALWGASGGTLALDRIMICIEGTGLALFDRVTGRRIVLQLNSAHEVDQHGTDPLYRLLAHLSDRGACCWQWGPMTRLRHLPRVTCRDVIISPERWTLTSKDVEAVLQLRDPTSAIRGLLPGLGDRRWVGSGTGDMLLPIDLRRRQSIEEVLRTKRKRPSVELRELPQLEAPGLPGPAGGHVAEVCISLPRALSERVDVRPFSRARRARDWVYAKYYCGVASADHVVTQIAAVAEKLTRSGEARRWFFIRYEDDGGYHIRARVQPLGTELRGRVIAVLDELGARLTKEHVATGMRLDEYVPETRRYGGRDGLRCAEALFCLDSADIARKLPATRDEEQRLQIGACDVINWWLRALGDPSAALAAMQQMQRGQLSILGSDRRDGRALGKLFRRHVGSLDEAWVRSVLDPEVGFAIDALIERVRSERGPKQAENVIGSVLHMHCNRWFAFDPPRLEFLAYEFAIRKTRQLRALGLV